MIDNSHHSGMLRRHGVVLGEPDEVRAQCQIDLIHGHGHVDEPDGEEVAIGDVELHLKRRMQKDRERGRW